jgi:hypothetical protein
MKLTADCLFGRSSRAKKTALSLLALGIVVGAGLGWVTTAGFHSNSAVTHVGDDPTSTGSPPRASEALRRPRPNDDIVASNAAPERTRGAWLERWWMDVQESVKRVE